MHVSSNRPLSALFKKSVLEWRKNYLASKAVLEQLTGETPAEKAESAPVKIIRPGRFSGRR